MVWKRGSRKPQKPYGHAPKGWCHWCGGNLKPPKRHWCSKKCIDSWFAVSDKSIVAMRIYKRDRGNCRLCGIDCSTLEPVERGDGILRRGWDIDHAKPLCLGGTGHDWNLRLLCIACHKIATEQLVQLLKYNRARWRPRRKRK